MRKRAIFNEHERLLGGYGSLNFLNGVLQLTTLGFFKTNCFFGEEEPLPQTADDAVADLLEPKPVLDFGDLEVLPDFTDLPERETTRFESHTGSPGETSVMKREKVAAIVFGVVVFVIFWCYCIYVVLKHRGKCCKRTRAQDQGQPVSDQSTRQ